jgi:hypothetical protein
MLLVGAKADSVVGCHVCRSCFGGIYKVMASRHLQTLNQQQLLIQYEGKYHPPNYRPCSCLPWLNMKVPGALKYSMLKSSHLEKRETN